MSQEPDTSMELSQQDWLEMWPYLQDVMAGVEEAALRNTIGKLFAALAEFPQARESFLRVLDNPLATASNNGLRLFVKRAEKKAFERAIRRGLRLLQGGYAEWDRLDEVGNVSFRPQCLDPLSTYILTNLYSSGPGVTRAVMMCNERRSRRPWGNVCVFRMGQHGKLHTSRGI